MRIEFKVMTCGDRW